MTACHLLEIDLAMQKLDQDISASLLYAKGVNGRVEGRMFESRRKGFVVNMDGPDHACPLCRLNMDINYTDVMIISQFVQEDGEIVPRQITGLCYSQHANMRRLIKQTHRAGLMQHLRPHIYPDEYHQMSDFAWKRYNTYFTNGLDEENKH